MPTETGSYPIVYQNEARFVALVARELRNKANEDERRFLRSEPVVRLWREALERIGRDLQNELERRYAVHHRTRERGAPPTPRDGCRGADGNKAESYDSWRRRAARIRRRVRARMRESESLLRGHVG